MNNTQQKMKCPKCGELISIDDVLTHQIEEKIGKEINEKGIDSATGNVIVEIDSKYFRPTEVDLLIGNPSKAKKNLGWVAKHDLQSLVKDMVQADLNLFKKDKYLKEGGHDVLNYNE